MNEEKAKEILEKVKSKNLIQGNDRNIYRCVHELENMLVEFRLYQNRISGEFYNRCEYALIKSKGTIIPSTMTVSNIDTLYEILSIRPIVFSIISYRKYGEPKLVKPKELKGVAARSVECFENCKGQYFFKGSDLYIKHRDYFSPSLGILEDMGISLEYRIKKYGINSKKSAGFVYDDCWGDVVLRSEAWLLFENVGDYMKYYDADMLSAICCERVQKFHGFEDELDRYWHEMFKDIFSWCITHTGGITNE